MRELKFRVWRARHKKMDCDPVVRFYSGKWVCEGEITNWQRDKIMQYTGLTDKSGKEICEGDIVKYAIDLFTVEYGPWDEGYGFYFYPIECARNKNKALYICHECEYCISEACEIIGNIYENPELIEGDKNA